MPNTSQDNKALAKALADAKFDQLMLIDALRLCLLALEGQDLSQPRVSAAITRANKVLECIK